MAELCVLEAYEYVDPSQVAEYEELGRKVQQIVKQQENQMMVHLQTKVSHSSTEVTYRWLEVFDGTSGLKAHFTNPAVVEHIKFLTTGIITRPTEIYLHGQWRQEQRDDIKAQLPNALFVDPINVFYREI